MKNNKKNIMMNSMNNITAFNLVVIKISIKAW